jgi:lipopolysaccharide transport system ATP-binding protein
MSEPIIKVEHLSKSYIINHEGQERYTALRDVVANRAKKLFSFPSSLSGGVKKQSTAKEEFWALKDVSFEINQGDRVGIIGRNGAGKSTLLKILSRITEPTSGRISIHGRVASLLEVGTGFHPELTGRENIFLNGAILGMTRAEIRRKFDEIVAFAEIERFLDTPVKRYSSGMYVRLAFAVAAHLEPEILVIDEVLAVGDAQFQKKCLGKMNEVSNEGGRTILFVSHNMAAVKQLCTRGITLHQGRVGFQGSILDSVSSYQSSHASSSLYENTGSVEDGLGNENIKILKFAVQPLEGEILSVSSGLAFELVFYNYKININLDATFELSNSDDVIVFHQGVLVTTNSDSKKGIYHLSASLPSHLLNAGNYKFKLIFGEEQRYPLYVISDFIHFEVLNESFGSNSNIAPGVIKPNLKCEVAYTGYSKEHV